MEEKTVKKIEVPLPRYQTVQIDIEGDEFGMLQNNLTDQAKKDIEGLDKGQPGEKKKKPNPADKMKLWEQTGHVQTDGRRGHPYEALLKAVMRVSPNVKLSSGESFEYMSDVPRALSIIPTGIGKDGKHLVAFTDSKKTDMEVEPAKHWAMLQGKTPVPVYRTHLTGWKMTVTVRFAKSILTAADVLALFNFAGESIGIGAYRIEKGGPYGRFHVVGARELN